MSSRKATRQQGSIPLRFVRRWPVLLSLAWLVAIRVSAADCSPPSASLVGWWPGDGSATNIAGTNHGTLQGGATATAAGLVDNAFTFDGTNAYVRITNSVVLQPSNLTVEAWVRFSGLDSAGSGAAAGVQYIVFKQNTRNGSSFEGFDLSKTRVGGTDPFRFIVSSASGQSVMLLSTTLVSTGQWYHVAAVRGSNFVQLYVNGVLERQTSVTFPQNYGNFPLYFGTSGKPTFDRKFKGNLDEVSLYNRALSSNEIAAIFAAGSAGKCRTPVITAQPQSAAVAIGGSTNFTVVAAGLGTPSYQWQSNGVSIPGATTATLLLTNIQTTAAAAYSVLVANSFGSVTSAVATLTVLSPPVITDPPASHSTVTNADTTFQVSVTGDEPLHYQWQKAGVNLVDGPRIQGARTNILNLLGVQSSDLGAYRVVVSNAVGVVTSTPVALTFGGVLAWGDWADFVPPDATNIVAISAGLSHSLGLRADGTVAAWGWNFWGQNNVPSSATNVVGVAAGGYHSLALRADGTVVGWGNYDTQAIIPPNATNVVSICAGDFFSLALRRDGSVIGWGWGANGELNIPASATNIVALTCGGFHALALRADGTVVAWGSGQFWGQTAVPAGLNNIVAIAAGELHSLALRSDGTVVGWGQVAVPEGLSNVVAIAAGYSHNLALRRDGTVVAWGGDGTGPTAVPLIATNVIAIAAGGGQSLALLASSPLNLAQVPNFTPEIIQQPRTQILCDGETSVLQAGVVGALPQGFQWHFNNVPLGGATNRWLPIPNFTVGQSGNYQLVVTNPIGVVTSAVANLSDCGIRLTEKPANRQLALGQMSEFHIGAIGTGPIFYRWQKDGVDLATDSHIEGLGTDTLRIMEVRSSDAGAYGCLMTNAFGSATNAFATLSVVPVRVWGYGGLGELNIPDAASNLIALATGYYHHLGVRPDGTLSGWGYDNYGQATPPNSATGIVAAAAGFYHSLALRTNGSLVAWGNNQYKQINVPGEATNIVRIAAGQDHNLALRADGAVKAWGLNNAGQTNVPPDATNIVALAAGDFHSLALRADGVVLGWGDNTHGQSTPPPGLSGVIALAAGRYHSLALRTNGTVAAWGDDTDGQCSGPASAQGVIGIDAGYSQSVVLFSNRTVHAWGSADYGVTNVPPDLTNVVWVGIGGESALVLLQDPELPIAPTLLMPPRDRAAMVGSPANLYAAAAGPPPLRWQWFFQGALLAGQTNSWLALPQVQFADSGPYHVVVANDFGSVTSAVANLTAALPPDIVTQPVSQVLLTSTNLALSVVATGTTPLGFQWQKDGTNLVNGLRVNGATSDQLFITSLLTNDSGSYRVVVTNVIGVVTSSVAQVSVFAAPFIVTPPTNLTVFATVNTNLSVFAGGTAPLSYQWRFNSSNLPGKTNTSLALTNIQAPNAGDYTVVVSNAYGMITSAVATLTVLPTPPTITTQAVSRVLSVGQAVSFIVAAKGSEPLTCQWQFNGSDLPGANSFTLTLNNVNSSFAGTYRAAVSNVAGFAFGTNVTLTVTPIVVWGRTNAPQLQGAGTIPASATNVVAIAAAKATDAGTPSLALRADGLLVNWGGFSSLPINATNVVAISSGGPDSRAADNNLALLSNGVVLNWSTSTKPPPPAAVTNGNIVAVAAGGQHQLALRDDGMVFAWGSNTSGQTNVPTSATNVIAIAAGASHSLALRADGTVVGWGLNSSGQATALSNAANVKAIAAGGNQSMALLADGSVFGRVVTNTGVQVLFYGPPPANWTNISAIAAGMNHSLALRTDGSILGWGYTNFGLTTAPAYATNVLAISAGASHNLALVRDPFAPPIPPRIGRPPIGRALKAGDNVVFNALAVGGLPLSYQWLRDGSPLGGKTNQWLSLTGAYPSDAGEYQLIVTNDFGSVTSAVASVTVSLPPPALKLATRDGDAFSFTLKSISGVRYVSEFKNALETGAWTEFDSRIGIGATETITDTNALTQTRFYRVRAIYPPPP